jgi:hypothetical protein
VPAPEGHLPPGPNLTVHLEGWRGRAGDEIGGYRILRVRPESTREVGHVDVVQITEDD